jgi:hypothetical protein
LTSNHHRRLDRVEQLLAGRQHADQAQHQLGPRDLFAEIAATAAYLRRETNHHPPRRPCPSGINPAVWEARGRAGEVLMAISRGDPAPDDATGQEVAEARAFVEYMGTCGGQID